jgi:transcriptional regulator with XRE-family HTH domain
MFIVSLGEKLRSLRMKSKNTLKEQGRIFGVSMNTVYRWEQGICVPRHQALEAIAYYYKVPMEWLLINNEADEISAEPAGVVSVLEQQLLDMFRKLPDNRKYKVMGYVECMLEEFGM